ncbi:MAG TPA: SOS response-associated peptidase [Planktothrix sp.]
MCGRYTISHSTEEILERFQILAEKVDLRPNYNVAPSQMVPIVVSEEPPSPDEPGSRLLQICKWGLLPFWAKDPSQAKPLINARAETLTEKKVFKKAFIKRRCVIPADGFYEWKKLASGKKQPMRICFNDGRLFGFAGIYQDMKTDEGEMIRTVAIITVPASEVVKDIHDRMPAILNLETEKIWLDPEIQDEAALSHCLQPYGFSDLEAFVVSTGVNKVSTNTPELIERLSAEQIAAAENAEPEKKKPSASKKKSVPVESPGQLKLPFA